MNADEIGHFCSLKCAGDFANAPELYLGAG